MPATRFCASCEVPTHCSRRSQGRCAARCTPVRTAATRLGARVHGGVGRGPQSGEREPISIPGVAPGNPPGNCPPLSIRCVLSHRGEQPRRLLPHPSSPGSCFLEVSGPRMMCRTTRCSRRGQGRRAADRQRSAIRLDLWCCSNDRIRPLHADRIAPLEGAPLPVLVRACRQGCRC